VALVIGRFNEKDLPVARAWLRSWKTRGWRTGIGLGRNAGLSLRVINFSLVSPKRGREVPDFRPKRYGAKGWQTAALVKFPPGATEDEILNCGRSL